MVWFAYFAVVADVDDKRGWGELTGVGEDAFDVFADDVAGGYAGGWVCEHVDLDVEEEEDPKTGPLSPYVDGIVQALLRVTER